MLAVISPAKTLDFESEAPVDQSSRYRFGDQSQTLIEHLRALSVSDVKSLMKLSDNLAQLNVDRYLHWHPRMTRANSKQALFAFKGDVYTGLSAETLTVPQIELAQSQLRILSGLYGLLKPLDNIQPYRLEMGTRLATEEGNSLYDFWGEQITEVLNKDLKKENADVLINLASNEYFKAVKPHLVKVPIITPIFKDEKNGEYKIISFFAKKARGLMVRYILDTEPNSLSQLKAFDYAGYQYAESESDDFKWVFKRKEQTG